MKIIRNGNEFELTKKELYQAYLEQEHEFDRDSCLYYIDECFSEEEWYSKKSYDEIVQLADKMADEFRRIINRDYVDDEAALDEAWKTMIID